MPQHAGFKRQPVGVGGQTLTDNNPGPTREQRQLIRDAIETIETSHHIKPVRLRGVDVKLAAGQTIELRGKVPSASRVCPRTPENLRWGLNVVKAEVRGEELHILVQNCRRWGQTTLTPRDVLADIRTESDIVEALVGPSCEEEIEVEGMRTKCLLDSGSQVTIVSERFYRQHLAHLPIQELAKPVTVLGAGGQSVPYLGHITMQCRLPEVLAGEETVISVACLVGQGDTKFSETIPIILGTNVFRDLPRSPVTDHVRCEALFMRANAADSSDLNGKVGTIVLKKRTVIPPMGTASVVGQPRVRDLQTVSSVLVQEHCDQQQNAKVGLVATKVDVQDLHDVRLTLCNFSDVELVVQKNTNIADVYVAHAMYDMHKVLEEFSELPEPHNVTLNTHTVTQSTNSMHTDISETCQFRFGESAPEDWCRHFSQRLSAYSDVFIQHDLDIGRTEAEHHDINLEPGCTVRERPRPISPRDFEEAKQHIQELLEAKIISPSCSPFASPIVLVRKKNNSLRLCVDYRAVNRFTVKDSYAIPKIDDLFLTLNGGQWFTSMDLSKAYYQVPLTERAKQISAFTTPFGLFQFERMPFGLCNSPATFQQLMDRVFMDMNLSELIVFLDDILIHGRTLEELEDRTIRSLERLRKFKLKLDPQKCVFGTKEVRHLGHVISDQGIKPDPEKISALTSWPVPRTVKDVKSFIGFAGFYRKFIPKFAQMAKPLNDLTAGYIPRGIQKKGERKKSLTLTSDITHMWGDKQKAAFEALIQALTSEPLLAVADRTKPFTLHCDASGTGIGAVLYQEQDGKSRVIAYASRSLNKTESNYPAHKREFLALKWAMTEKFHDYILGTKVTVVTDNNPLRYILHKAKLDAVSHRWLASLSIYDFDIQYKRGSTHLDADGLSRRHDREELLEDAEYHKFLENTEFIRRKATELDNQTEGLQTANSGVVRAVMEAKGIRPASNKQASLHVPSCSQSVETDTEENLPAVEQLITDPSLIPDDILEPKENGIHTMGKREWRRLQLADPTLNWVIQQLEKSRKLSANTQEGVSPEMRVFIREQNKLVMKEDVLHRKVEDEEGRVKWQLVIPTSKRQQAMSGVHEDIYHPHLESALQQARLRFFWPFMARDLENKIRRCGRCVRRGATKEKAPMETITSSVPLELLSIDYLTIEVKGQKQNILVILDHFTKFGVTVCTKDQKAKTVAQALWQNFFMIYGFPQRILSDQGRDFESELLKEVCRVAGIKKCRTTPYHPAGSPVERLNREIIHRLRSLEDEQKKDWRKSLPAVMHAYNCSVHSSTGYSPYYLFFGRHPRLPIDLAFGIDLDSSRGGSPRQFVRDMKNRLQEAYTTASDNMDKRALRNKTQYDTSAHAAELEVGDRVLVRRLGPRITSKVSDRWEKGVYVVVDKPGDMPVYSVRLEGGIGPVRTLHRNLLLPIGVLDEETTKIREKERGPMPKRKTEGSRTERQDFDEEDTTPLQVEFAWPSSELRPEASVFVPISEPLRTDVVELSESPEGEQVPETGMDSGQEPSEPADEAQHDLDLAESEGDQEDGSGDDLNRSEPEEAVGFDAEGDQPAPEPRRSLRQRRPVDRLNLAHIVPADSSSESVTASKVKDLGPWLKQLEESFETFSKSLSMIKEHYFILAKKCV